MAASLVKNMGYRSLSGDFAGGSIEFSRLFYGAGLVVAGVAADRDRRLAFACCAASLVVPILQIALEGADVPGFVLWSLGYALQGFFIVWRVVLFADIVAVSGRPWLAGAGLAFGRVGDALGTWATQALSTSPAGLVVAAFAMLVGANALLFRLAARMLAASEPARDGEGAADAFDPLVEFSGTYGLSRREKDVLYFLLDGRTNAEAAKELCVTEATVKFHVSNILKKTGCASRNDVANLYNQSLRGW